ncbi:MAG: hypothetical protein J0L67_01015 [Cytophagales bacterium]|nr:hypothetical protein [Cytophagales bacterium]
MGRKQYHNGGSFYFQSPLGLLGEVADSLVLKNYLTRLLTQRNSIIKHYAEGDGWQHVLPKAVHTSRL